MKKLVSLVLALLILTSCLPMSVFATDAGITDRSIMPLGEIAEVTITTEGNGGYVEGSGSYSVGSTAVVTATIYPNGEFYGWFENGELVSPSYVYDFTVLGDVTLVAKFKNLDFYNFSAVSTEGGKVEAPEGKYCAGEEINFTATADEGYVFAGWVTTAGKVDKANAENTKITMPSSDVTLTAKFMKTDDILGEWVKENGKKKYKYKDGTYKGAGWELIEGEWYYFDKYGNMMTGWVFDNYWYYINPLNGIMQRGWVKISGEDYYFDSTGVMYTGWLAVENGKKYYFNPANGIMQRGWVELEGKKYYFDKDGVMLTGWQKIDEKWYLLDNINGDVQYGWVATNGKMYYCDATTGVRAIGWTNIDGKWYYLDEADASLRTGHTVINGEHYYLGDDGVMYTGWYVEDGKTYYYNPTNGIMQRGTIKVDNKLYFMDNDGVMLTGWFDYEGKTYYTNLDNSLATEWVILNGNWYYFDPVSGAMHKGWSSIDGLWYEFNKDGVYQQVAEPIGKDFTAKITTNADQKKALSLSGNNVELRTDDGETDQQWRFILQADGSYKIINLGNNWCLDVADGKTENGTNIQTWKDNELPPQKWIITRDGENEGYTFRPLCSIDHYTVMDVINAETADGTNIVLSKSHFGANQQFTITKLSEEDPDVFEPKYCLVGNINGKDVGCEGDWENVVNELDENNQITLTFTEESYVFLKDTKNENWFMTLGWQGKVNEATLYNSHTTELPDGTKFDKLYVPAGTYTFTATENEDGSIHLIYTEPLAEIDTLYLVPGSAWKADKARFAAYYFNDAGGKEWVSMTDEDEDGVYEAAIPEGEWTNVIFCRMNPEKTENNWENNWNQTNDLAIEERKNCFTITHPWSVTNTGEWSYFTPGMTPPEVSDPSQGDSNPDLTEPAKRKYCLIGYIDGVDVGDGNNWEDIVNVFDENGQITLTIEEEAYVCVKDTTCSAWFMTLGWLGKDVTETVLYNANTTSLPEGVEFNKLYVPAGTYTFTIVENADGTVKLSYKKYVNDQISNVIGDIDNSGEVTISDVTYIQKTLIGFYEVSDETKLVGDVNGNGKLEIRDATLIQLYIANKIDKFPVESK